MNIIILLISGLLGAFGRRICGGLFETWTNLKWGQPTRLFFGFTLALSALISGASLLESIILMKHGIIQILKQIQYKKHGNSIVLEQQEHVMTSLSMD